MTDPNQHLVKTLLKNENVKKCIGFAAKSFQAHNELPHLDSANLAFSWCAITTFGNFNPDWGGHLILWDLRVYIQFPPGSTIFIPLAIVVHSNLPIEEGEKFSSMTHYTAGSLFQWRYNNGHNDKQFEKMVSKEEKLQKEWDNKSQWDEASKYFPRVFILINSALSKTFLLVKCTFYP